MSAAANDQKTAAAQGARFYTPADLQPTKKWGQIETVDNADLTPDMMMSLIVGTVKEEGLVGHNIRAFNSLVTEGIPHIVANLFRVDRTDRNPRDQTAEDRERESFHLDISFSDVSIGRPECVTRQLGRVKPLTPNEARLTGRTYAAPLTMSIKATITAERKDGTQEVREAEVNSIDVANIPIMVGSNRCHTWGLTREAKKGMCENPDGPGGYFIAKGGEWAVDLLENIIFNTLHVHRRVRPAERTRGEFISQPGGAFENSSQVVIRQMTSGALTIEINSRQLNKLQVPFYILFRLLGVTSDRKILGHIVPNPDSGSPVDNDMVEIINAAFLHKPKAGQQSKTRVDFESLRTELDRERIMAFIREEITDFVAENSRYRDNDNAVQYLNERLMSRIDTYLLPHMGTRPEDRIRKIRFLGMLIHNTLLVDLGIHEPTDRDSLASKRIHGPGVSLAKAIKTQFNSNVVVPMTKAIRRELRNKPFETITNADIVDAIRKPVGNSDLSRALEQALTSGEKAVTHNRKTFQNRVSSFALELKNGVNQVSSLRTVSAHSSTQTSKMTERADKRRRVHTTFPGYICIYRSADTGEMVGVKKALAITATVCSAGDPHLLRQALLTDPELVHLESIPARELAGKAKVFINGEWLGCCTNPAAFVARYRSLRRENRIVAPRVEISRSETTNDVNFRLDVGRLIRPLLIVDNNLAEYDEGCRRAAAARSAGEADWKKHRVDFVQNTRLTAEHVRQIMAGEIGIEQLRVAGLVEWITPGESTNCLLAASIGVLREHRSDVTTRFTHVDVEQAICGLTALITPFASHTQSARVTYETNQGRQACGWFSLAWPFRVDKNRMFQWYIEQPLVRTITDAYISPNGCGVRVAYMVNGGYNQEDSATFKSTFVDAGGFAGSFYRHISADLEVGEQFGSPDPKLTKNLKPNASYEKLVDGFVRPGTIVRKNDVIISRFAKIQAGGRRGARAAEARDDGYQFIDRSVVYRLDEPAVVTHTYRPHGPNDKQFGIVKLRYLRMMRIGDKCSTRAGNKSINANIEYAADMPYDENGVTPDIIVGPHSIPTRMTIGQMLESQLGKACEAKGGCANGTAFSKASADEMSRELLSLGFRYSGTTRMYSGKTGEVYNAAIYCMPTFYQRLQKFVLDDKYAAPASGPTDALTGQPLEGKSSMGGLRFGEMEGWVSASHGSAFGITEKMFVDSDGTLVQYCRNQGCGLPAVYNDFRQIYSCRACKENADIVEVDSCQASRVLQQEMRTSNIEVRAVTRPRVFEEHAEPVHPSPVPLP